ncbi:MAG: glycosyltransferase [Pelagibaca sp.]
MRPTGIDRIERAYIDHLIDDPAPLFGLVRTRLGFLLLDKPGCAQLLTHCDEPVWTQSDLMSLVSRTKDAARARTESGLRKIALDRALPSRLTRMLRRHLQPGTVYLNVGQSNFNDRVVHAVRACDGLRIGVYLHDTIPLDWPEFQTPKARQAFKAFFAKVDRHADLVLCNSQDTRSHVLKHAQHLDPERIHVLLPGLPDIRVGAPPEGPWTGKPYFVAIGTIEPRKNIGFLLDLWEDFTGDDEPHLVLCGRRGWMNEDVFSRLDQRLAHVHELASLDDHAMWGLLEHSNGLLFPSRAEGFGYPAVEATRLDVPLICNPLPVFDEVLGRIPIYAAESDRYAWRKEIEQLAHRRRDRRGEQNRMMSLETLTWQAHFNQLFTVF